MFVEIFASLLKSFRVNEALNLSEIHACSISKPEFIGNFNINKDLKNEEKVTSMTAWLASQRLSDHT
jgi:hypothetical protein